MRLVRFFLSYSLFISICAIALAAQTAVLLGVQTAPEHYVFIFAATLGTYNAYCILAKTGGDLPDLPSALSGSQVNLFLLGLSVFGILWTLYLQPGLLL